MSWEQVARIEQRRVARRIAERVRLSIQRM